MLGSAYALLSCVLHPVVSLIAKYSKVRDAERRAPHRDAIETLHRFEMGMIMHYREYDDQWDMDISELLLANSHLCVLGMPECYETVPQVLRFGKVTRAYGARFMTVRANSGNVVNDIV